MSCHGAEFTYVALITPTGFVELPLIEYFFPLFFSSVVLLEADVAANSNAPMLSFH